MSNIKLSINTLSQDYLVSPGFKSLLFFTVVSFLLFTSELAKADNTRKEKKIPGIGRVWAIDDGEKIKQEDINNPLASSVQNPVWNGTTINLFGGRNEVVAFQLIIQADNSGAKNIDVKLKALTNGSNTISNAKQANSDPFDYTGKHIEFFTEHYVNLTRRTEPRWFYHPNAKPSDYYLGWIPDALIPFEAPSGKGGVPFDISANKNQGVWVDIWIPREAAAGLYKGTIQLIAGKKILEIPIVLKVCNFIIPDEFHAHNMFYMEPSHIAKAHGTDQQSNEYFALETKYREMAHRHRIDLVSKVNNLHQMDIYDKKYLTGEMYTSAYKYDGPGEGVGNMTFSIGPYGSMPSEYKWSREGWWKGADAWEEWFVKNAPQVERHKYLRPDEPVYWKKGKGGGLDSIKLEGNWSHSNPGPGKNIPGLVTVNILPELKGSVDFWSLPSHEIFPPKTMPADFREEISAGRKWGFYNGFRPSSGAVIIDADAIEFRVQPWIMWKYKADQYFYWETTYWSKEMFSETETNDRAFGDGSFFYPGQNKQFPDQDRGLAGPFSSIRMKNWRRGAQDYEYLWLLNNAGLNAPAKAIADNCIPRALIETDISKDISWSNHGYGFDKYRKQMANMLDSLATIRKK
jgi:hypothetical protein